MHSVKEQVCRATLCEQSADGGTGKRADYRQQVKRGEDFDEIARASHPVNYDASRARNGCAFYSEKLRRAIPSNRIGTPQVATGFGRGRRFNLVSPLQGIASRDVAEHGGARFDDSALRLQIHGHDTELWLEAGHPLEVIQQRPGYVAAHVHAIVDGAL